MAQCSYGVRGRHLSKTDQSDYSTRTVNHNLVKSKHFWPKCIFLSFASIDDSIIGVFCDVQGVAHFSCLYKSLTCLVSLEPDCYVICKQQATNSLKISSSRKRVSTFYLSLMLLQISLDLYM